MNYIYDQSIDIRGWFSALMTQAGWFDQELTETGGTPPVVSTVRQRTMTGVGL